MTTPAGPATAAGRALPVKDAKRLLMQAWFEAHPNQPMGEGRNVVERCFSAIEHEARALPLSVEALARALHESRVGCSNLAGSVVVSPSGASPLDRVVLTCQPGHHTRAATAILAALEAEA